MGTRLRVAGRLFHSSAPRGRCLSTDERSATYSHHHGRVATFRQVVEMCTADPVSAAELRNREREHIHKERLRGRLEFA